jgi:RimJ/RimL family protein N-acetyltransferase
MEEKIVFKGKTKTGRNLIIRYIKSEDIPKLLEYINKISLEKTFVTFQGEQLTLESETDYVNKKIESIKNKKSVALVAFINDELVGSSDVDLLEVSIRSHQGVFGIIIAQKYRGEGIGKILMKSVIRETKKNIKDIKIITLEVFGDNPIAQKLYKSLGFVEFGKLPKGLRHKNKFVDEILMYKKIK